MWRFARSYTYRDGHWIIDGGRWCEGLPDALLWGDGAILLSCGGHQLDFSQPAISLALHAAKRAVAGHRDLEELLARRGSDVRAEAAAIHRQAVEDTRAVAKEAPRHLYWQLRARAYAARTVVRMVDALPPLEALKRTRFDAAWACTGAGRRWFNLAMMAMDAELCAAVLEAVVEGE